MRPKTRYAKSGDVHIAYQVIGDGPIDLVWVPGWVSHLEGYWEMPPAAAFFQQLASFARLILFDKRGTGMSDRVSLSELPTLEQRMDDVRAVLDAVGSQRAALVGLSEGGPMSALFAATYPQRTAALVMLGSFAKMVWEETAWSRHAPSPEAAEVLIQEGWAQGVPFPGLDVWAPSIAHLEEAREQFARFVRLSASPAAAVGIIRMAWDTDVRHVLSSIRVPTLVLHRSGDRALATAHSRYLADHISGARYVELPGTR